MNYMETGLYKKNIDFLHEKFPDFHINDDAKKPTNEIIEKLCLVPGLLKDYCAEVWVEQFEEIDYEDVIVVFGLGNLSYISQLSEKFSDVLIIVYEPCEGILYYQLYNRDISSIFGRENITLITGEGSRKVLRDILQSFRIKWSYLKVHIGVIPNYKHLYFDDYVYFMEELNSILQSWIMNANTIIYKPYLRGKCYLHNMLDLLDESDVTKLKRSFEKYESKNIPAVIIAAGPSLDKNIDELKDYQGKVFIICTDTAVQTAYNHGIRPDLIVCVDPLKPAKFFKSSYGKDVPLISALEFNSEVSSAHKGRKFYFEAMSHLTIDFLRDYDIPLAELVTGGSVTGAAYFCAKFLGFKKLIFIGLDLAFTDNKDHTEPAEGTFQIDKNEQQKLYLYVKGIDGKPVLSILPFAEYIFWLQERLIMDSDIEMIDATEGGALIEGAKLMKFSDALAPYQNNPNYDFEETILNTEYIIDAEHIDVKEKLYEILDGILELPDKMEEVRTEYAKLKYYIEREEYDAEEFRQCLQRTGEFAKKMDEDIGIRILDMFATKGAYSFKLGINKRFVDKKEELNNIIEVSETMIDEYESAVKVFSIIYNEVKEVRERELHGRTEIK